MSEMINDLLYLFLTLSSLLCLSQGWKQHPHKNLFFNLLNRPQTNIYPGFKGVVCWSFIEHFPQQALLQLYLPWEGDLLLKDASPST